MTSEQDAPNEIINYDSTADTLAHIKEVNFNIIRFCRSMLIRAVAHDSSKLGPDEKPFFDAETPKLKNLTFGSDEYKESLKRLGAALTHHYETNDHHPEHFHSGVNGMDLFQVVEMVMDWAAASQRNKGGRLDLQACYSRFKVDPQLAAIITNTALVMNFPLTDNSL